jgi:hypothetical protein
VDEEQLRDLEKQRWGKREAGKHQRKKCGGGDDGADDFEERQTVRNRKSVLSEREFVERRGLKRMNLE